MFQACAACGKNANDGTAENFGRENDCCQCPIKMTRRRITSTDIDPLFRAPFISIAHDARMAKADDAIREIEHQIARMTASNKVWGENPTR